MHAKFSIRFNIGNNEHTEQVHRTMNEETLHHNFRPIEEKKFAPLAKMSLCGTFQYPVCSQTRVEIYIP